MTILASTSCSSLYYHPDGLLHFPPRELGFSPLDVYFTSQDGTRLHGWLFLAATDKPKGTIVQFHGNAQNISAHYASLVWLVREGYNLFTFDYRGYGRSEGVPEPKGNYEDGVAALNLAWKLHKQNSAEKFIVFMQSMGGMIGMRSLVDFKERNQVDLLVLDSTFSSFEEIVQDHMRQIAITWLFSPLAPILVSDKWASKQHLDKFKNRVLLIHDREDAVVGFEHGKKLAERLNTEKDFWELREGGHVNIFTNNPKQRQRFVEYLDAL